MASENWANIKNFLKNSATIIGFAVLIFLLWSTRTVIGSDSLTALMWLSFVLLMVNLFLDLTKEGAFVLFLGISIGLLIYGISYWANWNIIESVPYGMVVISLTIGIVSLFIINSIYSGVSMMTSRNDGIKETIITNRFNITLLMLYLGLLILISGFITPIAWYFQYIISIVLMIPFVFVLVFDIIKKKLTKDSVGEWMKRMGIYPSLISILIGIILYFIFIYLIWLVIPEEVQLSFGLSQWNIISLTICFGIAGILNIYLKKNTFNYFKREEREKVKKAKDQEESQYLILAELKRKQSLFVLSIFAIILDSIFIMYELYNLTTIGDIFTSTFLLIVEFTILIILLSSTSTLYVEMRFLNVKLNNSVRNTSKMYDGLIQEHGDKFAIASIIILLVLFNYVFYTVFGFGLYFWIAFTISLVFIGIAILIMRMSKRKSKTESKSKEEFKVKKKRKSTEVKLK